MKKYLLILMVGFVGCKQKYWLPDYTEHNKIRANCFMYIGDSAHHLFDLSLDSGLAQKRNGNSDSVMFYAGKLRAYLEISSAVADTLKSIKKELEK